MRWTQKCHLERCDRNLVWLNELQVVLVGDGWCMVRFLTVTGAKKREGGEKGGSCTYFGYFQVTIITTSVEWKLDIAMTWQTKIKRIQQNSRMVNYQMIKNLFRLEAKTTLLAP